MTNPLCEFSGIFGYPNVGVHSYRIFNIAIIDVLFTVIGAYFIAKLMRWNFPKTLIGLFILGIVAHRLFCVRTTVDKLLFGQ